MDRIQLLNDPEAAQRISLDGRQAQIWTAMPAIVQSVDLDAMTLVAQIAIQGIQTNPDGTTQPVTISPLVDVPICFPSGGGFTFTLPLKEGDEVLVVLASRCIDAWWQSGGFKNLPIENRMHDLSDGFAIPGPKSQPKKISGISSSNAQIRTDDGSSYIELTPGGVINFVAPGGINMTTPILTVTGEVIGGVDSIPLSTHIHPTPVGNSGPPEVP